MALQGRRGQSPQHRRGLRASVTWDRASPPLPICAASSGRAGSCTCCPVPSHTSRASPSHTAGL